jgi:predicted AAA+ superfamily ATPase
MTDLHPVLQEKLNAALGSSAPVRLTKRDVVLPGVPNKAHAVTGMRRAGKTSYLRQLNSARSRELGAHRSIYLSFDDDRLADLDATQLSALQEAYYRRFPELRGREHVAWYLDEIQLVDGWERFVRRVLDTELVEIVVSGSSAKMLSREVHTSLRGRGIETVIRPFSFREFLRHRDEEPSEPCVTWTADVRSGIEKRFFEYLLQGGFPETQSVSDELRIELLQGYVDTVLFRDIVERHRISQVSALRWIVRHCLRNPAGSLSAHRLYTDLKAQGYAVSKDSIHQLLDHLLDTYLLALVPIHSASERQQNSNPRKCYPADPSLAHAFDSTGRRNIGHALEVAVFNELQRCGAEVSYCRTKEGFEVDFHARRSTRRPMLLQVCAEPTAPATLEREVRALEFVASTEPEAEPRLLVLTQEQALHCRAQGVPALAAYEWMLDEGAAVRFS